MSAWIDQIVASKIAKSGGVVRRKLGPVDKLASRKELKKECKSVGATVLSTVIDGQSSSTRRSSR